jgi:hypothetical protein
MKSIFQFLAIPLLLLSFSCEEKKYSISTSSIQEKKSLSEVTRIHIDGVFNLILIQSDQESIEVEGDEELIKKLLIDQDGARPHFFTMIGLGEAPIFDSSGPELLSFPLKTCFLTPS